MLGRVVTAYGPERLLGGTDAPEADLALRTAVAQLAAEARAEDPARGERLLLSLKRDWSTLPAIARVSDADVRRALWDRVVAIAVAEFYAPSHPRAPAA